MRFFAIPFALVAMAVLVGPARGADPGFQRLELPHGAVNPRGAVDGEGRIHVTYAQGNDAFYVRWEGGKRGEPVPVNRGVEVSKGGERGPQIAVAGDGAIGVVWQNRDALNCALSRDGGATWTPMDGRDAGASGGVDCPTIGSDGAGDLIAVWIDGREEDREDASAALYAAVLEPGGKRFGKNAKVNSAKTPACACCFPKVASDGSGKFWVAFRGVQDGVREIQLLASADRGKSFKGGPVSADKWKTQGCPMAGPAVTVSPDGKTIALAWRAKSKLRAALSRDGGKRFADIDLADGAGMKDYPYLAIGDQGLLLLWSVERKWYAGRIAPKAAAPAPFDPDLGRGTASIVRGKDGVVWLLAGAED